jgi:hypothetical protein
MGGAIGAVGDLFGVGPASRQAEASYDAAKYSSDSQIAAAQTAANAQLEAARMAADASRFRPVGMTNTFGTSSFGTDANGNVNSASYTLSPQLRAYQNFLAQQGGKAQGDVQGLLSLGRGYLGESPDAVKQRYISQQNALLAPQNEQALAGIRNNLFQQGRTGLATGATTAGGMAATNPEMAAYYNALAQQQNQLAAGAEQAAQQQVSFGQGLLSSAYSPLQTNLGVQQSIESLGQDPFVLGMNIGGKTAQAGGQAGQALLSGGLNAANLQNTAAANAARTMQGANSYSPTASALYGLSQSQGLNNAIGNWFSGNNYGGTPQGAYGQQGQYLSGAFANPQTQQASMLAEQNSWFN